MPCQDFVARHFRDRQLFVTTRARVRLWFGTCTTHGYTCLRTVWLVIQWALLWPICYFLIQVLFWFSTLNNNNHNPPSFRNATKQERAFFFLYIIIQKLYECFVNKFYVYYIRSIKNIISHNNNIIFHLRYKSICFTNINLRNYLICYILLISYI